VTGADGPESPNRMKLVNVKITRSGSGHPSAVVDETDGQIDEIMDRERMEGRRLPSLQSNRRKVLLDDL
jgi:hypothetical protein